MPRRTKKEASRAPTRRKALGAIAERFKSFRPAREALKVVRAVPTCFVQLDHATRVGGFPIERVTVIHGPSNQGKSVCALGLMKSFLRAGHFALFVDAERTSPITWAREVMGVEADSDRFFAERPATYERTVDRVREFLRGVHDLRAEKVVAPDATAIVVVDSVRKLVPEDILKKIAKSGASGDKGSVDGMGGRAAQIRAAMNAAWMDELVPLLDETGTAIVLIARETEDPDADVWQKKFGNAYKVGGGRALIYDASLVLRVDRESWVYDKRGDDRKVLGERHRVSVRKTKIGGREDRATLGYFHSANGVGLEDTSPGWRLDWARDLLDAAVALGVVGVDARGRHAWMGAGGWTLEASSLLPALAALRRDEGVATALEAAVRERSAVVDPTSHDEDGVVE